MSGFAQRIEEDEFRPKSPFGLVEELFARMHGHFSERQAAMLQAEYDAVIEKGRRAAQKKQMTDEDVELMRDALRRTAANRIVGHVERIMQAIIRKQQKSAPGFLPPADYDPDQEDAAEERAFRITRERYGQSLEIFRKACCDGWEPLPPREGMPPGMLCKRFGSAAMRDAAMEIVEYLSRCDGERNANGDYHSHSLTCGNSDDETGYYAAISRLPSELARDARGKSR